MRYRGLIGFLALVCLVAAVPASAAEQPPAGRSGAEGPQASEPGGYVVKKGDTLWDISRTYLRDPFLWPRLWEANRSIANPNLIYPGERLMIPAVGTPAAAPEAKPGPVQAEEVEKVEAPSAEAEKVEGEKPEQPGKEAEKEAAKEEAPKEAELIVPKTPPIPVMTPEALACSAFIQEDRQGAVGTVLRALDDRLMIGPGDVVFVALAQPDQVAVGDRLLVLRTEILVKHPRTGAVLGSRVRGVGVLELTRVETRVGRARVTLGCDALARGDQLMKYTEMQLPEGAAEATDVKVAATIVGNPRNEQILGHRTQVFLDVGTSRGVAPGDVFAVYRGGGVTVNPQSGEVLPLGQTQIGELVVVRASENTSTAVVTESSQQILDGDRVVLTRKIP